jgi:hypothetical protein
MDKFNFTLIISSFLDFYLMFSLKALEIHLDNRNLLLYLLHLFIFPPNNQTNNPNSII